MELKENSPHPKTAPDFETANVWLLPQAINAIGIPPRLVRITGFCSVDDVVPIPNCPWSFAPQAYMSPAV